jgi:hypothetical protein
MDTYRTGDVDGLLACLSDEWLLHEEDGSTTTRAVIAEITRNHAEAFPDKSLEYLHELVDGDHVAQHVSFTLFHSGRYQGPRGDGEASRLVRNDLPPAGRRCHRGELADDFP